MTGKEIGQMAFELKKTPRLPVTLIGGGAWAVNNAGKTFAAIKADPAQIAEVFIKYYQLFRHDLLWSGSNFLNYPISFLGCPIKDDSASYPVLEGTVINSLDEIEKLSIEKVRQNPIMQAIIRSHHLVAEVIGKETMIIPTQWAPFTFASRILGVEATMMATINDQERLKKLISFATELIWALLEPVLEHPDIDGANFSDPAASGDLISPATFRNFAAPALAELTRRVQSKGKYAMIHICGNTTKILEDILIIKPDCFSLENKVDLRIAKEIMGGKICVAGNVSPTGAFLSGTPEEVREEAQACLQAWGEAPGYILTVGCDFAKEVPLANMQALMSFKNHSRN